MMWHIAPALFAVAAITTVAPARAAYPERPLRIVTPFPAGSVTDVIARPLALSTHRIRPGAVIHLPCLYRK